MAGVDEARAQLRTSYTMIERQMATGTWAMGSAFKPRRLRRGPSLFYGNMVVPFDAHKTSAPIFERLKARSSFARVLREAEPYFNMVPKES